MLAGLAGDAQRLALGVERLPLVLVRPRNEQHVAALEIAARRDAVEAREPLRPRAEQVANLGVAPNEERALFTFGVGVDRRVERALRRRHFA